MHHPSLSSIILKMNVVLAILGLALGGIAYLFGWQVLNETFLPLFMLFCAAILIFYAASFCFMGKRSILTQMAADLLLAASFPQWLHQKTARCCLLIVLGSVILWMPLLFVCWQQGIGSAFLVSYLVIWLALFRALDHAEDQMMPDEHSAQATLAERQLYFWTIWLLFLLLCSFYIILMVVKFCAVGFSVDAMHLSSRQQIRLIGSGMAFLFSLLGGGLYHHVSKKNRLAMEKLRMQNQIDQQQIYIASINDKYKALRSYQHDLNKHLTYIAHLAQIGDTQAIQDYIATVHTELQKVSMQKLTGHQTLDILLSEKLHMAQTQNVHLQIDYQPSAHWQHIEAPDLCLILGNLLDNAITAAAKSHARQVQCELRGKNAYLALLAVSNSCDEAPHFANGLPVRDRPTDQHGYGAKIVQSRATACGGECSFDYDAQAKLFTAKVLFTVPTVNGS